MKATDLNTAVFTFGRMNPPTVGHAKPVDMIKRQPGKPYVFLSHTQKPKTDPLSFQQKLKYAKQSFTGVQIGDPGVTNIIGALQALEKKGYSNVIMVVGSDRVKQFQEFLPKYNGKDFKFDSIKVVSAGERDPDAEGVEGMSASKLKKFAVAGDFDSFTVTEHGDGETHVFFDVALLEEFFEQKVDPFFDHVEGPTLLRDVGRVHREVHDCLLVFEQFELIDVLPLFVIE